MSKVFARKKQLDMARQYRDVNDTAMDQEKNTEQVQSLVDNILGGTAIVGAPLETPVTKEKIKISIKPKA
jgi:hypothetical protein